MCWRSERLSDVGRTVAAIFPSAVVQIEAQENGTSLLAYWIASGEGTFVKLPDDVHPSTYPANDLIDFMIARLWHCAPIAGRA
jgi:hypothetical protein